MGRAAARKALGSTCPPRRLLRQGPSVYYTPVPQRAARPRARRDTQPLHRTVPRDFEPTEHMDDTTIIVRGAREHNLRNVNLELPRNQLIVFTGVSGSGKSSLAFDTLFAEGQRRYVESLSSYARQFMGQMQKPDVDYLAGLSPSISIQQKTAGKNPRS